MKDRDGGRVPDRPWRSICIPVLVVVFCLLSFYMGVIYSTERDNVLKLFDSPNLSVGVGCTQSSGPQGASVSENFTFSSCDPSFQDYTPCTDPKVQQARGIFLHIQSPFLMDMFAKVAVWFSFWLFSAAEVEAL